ncbi:MAG TPA: permease-like cell division protein FtsX [Solirubrobacterales bacterium]|nr:permease-like cell division protein FtsX [Solirubrobacterales bacterium]
MSRISFFIGEAFRALRRNGAPSMAAIVTTVLTVMLLGVLIPVFQTTQAKSSEVREQLELRVAVYDDATRQDLATLRERLAGLPHVTEVDFVSKAEALEELKTFLEDDSPITALRSNPLPANFVVRPDDAANLDTIRQSITPPGPDGEARPITPIVQEVFDRQVERQQIEQVTGAVKLVLTIITLLLIGASLMLIGNTIRLSIYARRREVEVMRLVGATRWFIRWPFMIEGVLVGFIGGVLAILMLWIGKITIVDPLSSSIGLLRAQDSMPFLELVVVLVAASVVVSAVGSGITLRRFLRV